MLTSLPWGDTQPVSLKNKKREDKMRKMPGSFRKKFFMSKKCWACALKEQRGSTWFVDFHCWQSKLTGQFLKIYSLKFDEIMSTSHFSPWTLKNKFWTKVICDTIKFLMKAIVFKNFINCFSFHSLGPFQLPREIEDKVPAKFLGDKQRALWYVMVFSGVVNCNVLADILSVSNSSL